MSHGRNILLQPTARMETSDDDRRSKTRRAHKQPKPLVLTINFAEKGIQYAVRHCPAQVLPALRMEQYVEYSWQLLRVER